GEELVGLVDAYRKRNDISAVTLPTPSAAEAQPQQSRKLGTDTRKASLALFQSGLSLDRIAEQRGLVRSTVEGHMAHWVARGTVAVEAFLPADKLRTILQCLQRMPGENLAEIRRALGADVSYADVRFARAHLDFLAGASDG
ncbi:MAG TPA: helix-turn-helix domain-containing protein, partial [Desulfosarcina sp.]|nr:helix-turn-helix domain-containing protein [Desulfosarcina sp.]